VLHSRGDEAAWWESVKIDPVAVAQKLREHARLSEAPGLENDAVPPAESTIDDAKAAATYKLLTGITDPQRMKLL
jgi:hypothetical protein